MNYPRNLAVRVITRVLSDGMPLDEALAAVSAEVPPEMFGWLQEVCTGTLRWKGRLDWIIDSISSRKKPSGWLRKILLLTAYQLIAQDRTPAGRVVSETVTEIKKKEGEAPARFANACLRKVADQAQAWRNLPFPSSVRPDSDQVAAWASLPPWMWQKMVKDHGVEWAKGFAQASLSRPTIWLRARDSDWNAEWAKAGPVPSSWEMIEGGSVTQKAGFREGEWIVQDLSSQFLIHEISQILKKELPGQTIQGLDLCAAPGGKSVGMAWSGIQMTATEIDERRVLLLKDTIARVAPEIQFLSWNEAQKQESKDLIWVDAPCSGSGIMRRHPDVRWLRKEKELPRLFEDQRKILKQAWSQVRPGGFLVYSVCSIFSDEGPGALLANGLESSKIKEWLLSPQDSLGGDGFWAALLRKS